MVRKILAVCIGFFLWTAAWLGGNAALRASWPDSYSADGATSDGQVLIGMLGLALLVSFAAGYVTTTVAAGNRLRLAIVLGVLLLVVGVLVQMQYWDVMPLWYHASFLALLLPCSWVGGLIRVRTANNSV